MSDDKYNGWNNKPTWIINLWDLGNWNEDDIPEDIRELEDRDEKVYQLSQYLEELYDEMNPQADSSNIWSDLMTYALGMVDWWELAAHLIDEIELDKENEEV